MIDPKKITNFGLDRRQLQEHLFFWIAVAGKKASTIAPRIDKVLTEGYRELGHRGPRVPYKIVTELGWERLRALLKQNGIGCHGGKAQAMIDVANSGFDLKTCTRDDLITIKGISFKTANCFIMHSRRNSRCAAFDTHVLKFMKAMGVVNVPDQAPQTLKRHEVLEKKFLYIADTVGFSPADLDLITWRIYAHHPRHARKFVAAVKQRMKSNI
jgi:hypothetical protein